jgi:hypothetical protein
MFSYLRHFITMSGRLCFAFLCSSWLQISRLQHADRHGVWVAADINRVSYFSFFCLLFKGKTVAIIYFLHYSWFLLFPKNCGSLVIWIWAYKFLIWLTHAVHQFCSHLGSWFWLSGRAFHWILQRIMQSYTQMYAVFYEIKGTLFCKYHWHFTWTKQLQSLSLISLVTL